MFDKNKYCNIAVEVRRRERESKRQREKERESLAVEVRRRQNRRVVTERGAVTERDMEREIVSGVEKTTASGEGGGGVRTVGQTSRLSVGETLDCLQSKK